MNDLSEAVRRILQDVKVELGDEFDRNFTRQGFFSKAWQRRVPGTPRDGQRAILTDTGQLRRSIRSVVSGNSITFITDLPYAAIHNEGGAITVTQKMKSYFWHKYYESAGDMGRRKDGSLRRDKRNERLSSEAGFWKALALKRKGSTIKIPKRTFLGYSPEVEKLVTGIIEKDLEEFFNHLDLKK